MDNFFSKQTCDRCGDPLANCRIQSMYNDDVLCLACKDAERQRQDYVKAVKADEEAIRQGNLNFKGIGLK